MSDPLTPEELAAIRERQRIDDGRWNGYLINHPRKTDWYQIAKRLAADRAALLRHIDAREAGAWRGIEGWKLVPVEPTGQMINEWRALGHNHGPYSAWSTFLSAAPSPPKDTQ